MRGVVTIVHGAWEFSVAVCQDSALTHRDTKDDEDDRKADVLKLAAVGAACVGVRSGADEIDKEGDPVENEHFVPPAGNGILRAARIDIGVDVGTEERTAEGGQMSSARGRLQHAFPALTARRPHLDLGQVVLRGWHPVHSLSE